MERHMPIEKWMSPNPVVVSRSMHLIDVIKLMDRDKISCVLLPAMKKWKASFQRGMSSII